MASERVIYVAKHPVCGHVRAAAIVHNERLAKDRNRAMAFLSHALRDGMHFDRVTDVAAVRLGMDGCSSCDPEMAHV